MRDILFAFIIIAAAAAMGAAQETGRIVGTWTNGNVSMLGERNTVTGTVTSRNGSTFKYVFHQNGSFEFVGLMQSTMYGCTTSLFNDKQGRYKVEGSQVTLTPTKNFWRNNYSCSPKSNKEKNHVLEAERLDLRFKTDEYGAELICFVSEKGESCYRKEKG